jgi:hypothetical protein
MKNLRIELLLHVHRLKYSIGIIAIETSVTLQLEQKLDTNPQKTYPNNDKFKKLPKQEGMKMQALSSHFLNLHKRTNKKYNFQKVVKLLNTNMSFEIQGLKSSNDQNWKRKTMDEIDIVWNY